MKLFALLLGLGVLPVMADDTAWLEVPREELDVSLCSPLGLRLLSDEDYDWTHAVTDHFVIHFERKPFAQKAARMAGFFYSFISGDLGAPQDLAPGPSHIFIFRNEKSWDHFIEAYGIRTEWAFSMVAGYTMYLQQADDREESGRILGHEMTHLVMNRFFRGRIPLWLNEGTAEWYGTFGYEAYRNIRRNKRNVFRQLKEMYPLEGLLQAGSYPADPEAVQSFYETAKYLVGFLQIRYPQDLFLPFLRDTMNGMSSAQALKKHYGLTTLEEFELEFKRFSR